MKTFRITANAIVTTVEAETEEMAVLAYVREAGYDSVAEAAEVCGQTEAAFRAEIRIDDLA